MKAVICPRYGGPEVLELREVPIPVPATDEVLVRVHAAGLNAADWHITRADPALVRLGQGLRRPRMKAVGADIAGVVSSVGPGVTGLSVGDDVFADLSTCGFGAFAEYVCVPSTSVARKPANLSFEEAAAVPLSGVTALQALRDQAALQPGERVLVHGASGGVGSYAVQIAVAMGGHVTAVCSAAKMEQMRGFGADEVVDYGVNDVFARGRQWDVILGVNGFQPLGRYRSALAHGGRYLMIGGAGKQMFQALALGRLRSGGGKTLSVVMAKPDSEKLDALRDYAEAGKLRPVIDRTYPLSDFADAMRYLEEGHSHGKTVLSIVGADA